MLQAPSTPSELSEPIVRLCAEVCANQVPVFVEVVPIAGATANDCFLNVQGKVAIDGGSMILGWAIWETPGLFVEAEFHAVWRSPVGDLVDLTPKVNLSSRILFLPQPGAAYSGVQVNNVRRAIGKDSDVEGYIRAYDSQFEFLNRGERARQHGMLSLSGKDALEYESIENSILMYGTRLARRSTHYDPYQPCWCGSGKKGKWCHQSVRAKG